MQEIQLSIIIPVKNGANYLQEALDTVVTQTTHCFELIIVDDNSTDDTKMLCEAVKKQQNFPVKLLRTNANNPAVTRNMGIRASQAPFITFIDHDDLWPADRITTHLDVLKNQTEVDVVLGKTTFFSNQENILIDDQFKIRNHTLHLYSFGAATFRKSVFTQLGYINEILKASEDQDFFLRANNYGLSILKLDKISLHYRLHDTNFCKNKNLRELDIFTVLHQSIKEKIYLKKEKDTHA